MRRFALAIAVITLAGAAATAQPTTQPAAEDAGRLRQTGPRIIYWGIEGPPDIAANAGVLAWLAKAAEQGQRAEGVDREISTALVAQAYAACGAARDGLKVLSQFSSDDERKVAIGHLAAGLIAMGEVGGGMRLLSRSVEHDDDMWFDHEIALRRATEILERRGDAARQIEALASGQNRHGRSVIYAEVAHYQISLGNADAARAAARKATDLRVGFRKEFERELAIGEIIALGDDDPTTITTIDRRVDGDTPDIDVEFSKLMMAYRTGRLSLAERLVARRTDPVARIRGREFLARMSWSRGRRDQARAMLNHITGDLRAIEKPTDETLSDIAAVQLSFGMIDDAAATARPLVERTLAQERPGNGVSLNVPSLVVRVLLARGQVKQARTVIGRMPDANAHYVKAYLATYYARKGDAAALKALLAGVPKAEDRSYICLNVAHALYEKQRKAAAAKPATTRPATAPTE